LRRRLISTVNEAEISHFSRLSSQWWDEQGEFKPLHDMNPVRVQFVWDKLLEANRRDGLEIPNSSSILGGLNVLDVGCGGGLLSESLARMGGRTTGIDASADNIKIASVHASRDPKLTGDRLVYRTISAEQLLEEEGMAGEFDVVCSMEVVEHVNNPASFLRSLAKLTKPGGHLFLSTIARTPLSYLLTIFLAENVLRMVTPGTHSHSKFINPEELLEFFHKDIGWISQLYNGLPTSNEADIRDLAYLPWKSEWLILPRGTPSQLQCNYILWARKPSVSLS